jgi:Flp pilus assembly protein TadG
MLLVVMLMITEFGRALYYYNLLAQATREGARAAVVGSQAGAATTAQTRMTSFLQNAGINIANVSFTGTQVQTLADGTTVVRARASAPFNWVFQNPLPANSDGTAAVSPTALTLSAETVMQAETF